MNECLDKMADEGQTSFSLSTNGVDHSSSSYSSSSTDKCIASVADPRLKEIPVVYTTKLDDMDVFNLILDCYDLSLNDITNSIARESKPEMKNIIKHSSRTEHTTSYDRVLKKIKEFNEKSSYNIVSNNDNTCTSLSNDSHASYKNETSREELHNNNNSKDNILETNSHKTLSKMHDKYTDIGNDTVQNPSSCINLSSDEDLPLLNCDKVLTKSTDVTSITKSRNSKIININLIKKRKSKNNGRKAYRKFNDATNLSSLIELSSDEDVVTLNDDEMLTKSTGINSRKNAIKKRKYNEIRKEVNQAVDETTTVSIIDDDSDSTDDPDDDEPLLKLKYNKQRSAKIQECKQLSIDLEDIGFRKRRLRMEPHNGTGFLYCGEWFSLSKISRADLKRRIRNVYLFFHDKYAQMIDIYTIEDGNMAEHMKFNSKINTVILKNNLNSKETIIEIECCCWYEREQAILKALELGILTTNNVMFMKQSHNCEQGKCVCCCSTQHCTEKLEIQTSEASRIDIGSVAEHYDWTRCLKSEDSNTACLINKCLTYDRFPEVSSQHAISTLDKAKENNQTKLPMPKSNYGSIIGNIEAERKKHRMLQPPKITVPTMIVQGPKQTTQANKCVENKFILVPKQKSQANKCVENKCIPDPKQKTQAKNRIENKFILVPKQKTQVNKCVEKKCITDPKQKTQAKKPVEKKCIEDKKQKFQAKKRVEKNGVPGKPLQSAINTTDRTLLSVKPGLPLSCNTHNNESEKPSNITDNHELPVTQKVKNAAELIDSLITKTVCTPTTKSSERQLVTINDEITKIKQEFVSSNSSSVSQSDDISTAKDDLGVDSLITTILERFQGVRLTINEKGKVVASLNMPINTLSSTEIEVLSKIITQAQQQVDALGLVPGTNLEYFNTNRCTSVQSTDHLQSSNYNPVLRDKVSPSCNFKLNTSDNLPCTNRDVVSLEAIHNKLKSSTDADHRSNNYSQVSKDERILSDIDNNSTRRNYIVPSEADISNDFYKTFSSVEKNRSECYRNSFLALISKVPVNISASRVVPFVADISKAKSDQITNRQKTSNNRHVMIMADKVILSNHDKVLASNNPPIETDKYVKIYKKFANIAMKRNYCYRKTLAKFQSKSSAYFSTSDSSSKNTKNSKQTAQREVTSGVPSKKRKAVTDGLSKTNKKKKPSEPTITRNQTNDSRSAVIPVESSSKGPKLSHEELAPATADLAIADVSSALHEEVDIKPEEVHISDVISDDLDNEDWVRAIKEEEEQIAQQVEIIAKINFGEKHILGL